MIQQSDREHPADAVLRDALWKSRHLGPAEARAASQGVFAYYRWHGWLDHGQGIEPGIRRALELAALYRQNPAGFSGETLRANAVPDWAAAEIDASDDWFRTLQCEPRLWLRARPGQGPALAAKLEHAVPFGKGPLADALEYRGTVDLFQTPEFHAGAFELQDISSQAVGLLCDPQPGETWWDACAGEGGKLLHLSDLMGNRGLIWASDRAGWRLQKLKRRAARAQVFNYRKATWNGGAKLPTRTQFDGVLVDAPCSGTGTWQRNPHARWTISTDDVRELSARQKQLLAHASAAVKPGGKLIYAGCTLTRSETDAVATDFERHHPEFRPLPVRCPLAPDRGDSARVWIWPQDAGGNGMFIAVWKRAPSPAV